MKQSTQSTEKKYVPYGMNGEYFVYDNSESQIPMGYGSKGGTKEQIQSLCDTLNSAKEMYSDVFEWEQATKKTLHKLATKPNKELFTPGEWEIRGRYKDEIWAIFSKDTDFAHKMRLAKVDGASEEQRANARLIANAPAMYDALKLITDILERWGKDTGEYKNLTEHAKVIIDRINKTQ